MFSRSPREFNKEQRDWRCAAPSWARYGRWSPEAPSPESGRAAQRGTTAGGGGEMEDGCAGRGGTSHSSIIAQMFYHVKGCGRLGRWRSENARGPATRIFDDADLMWARMLKSAPPRGSKAGHATSARVTRVHHMRAHTRCKALPTGA